jgi:hypothetical protein
MLASQLGAIRIQGLVPAVLPVRGGKAGALAAAGGGDPLDEVARSVDGTAGNGAAGGRGTASSGG